MKKKTSPFLMSVLLAGCYFPLHAQSLIKNMPPSPALDIIQNLRVPLQYKAPGSAQKPTGIQSRFISYYATEYDGATLVPASDSGRYFFENNQPGFDYAYIETALFDFQLPNTLQPSPATYLNDGLPQTIDSVNSYQWNSGAQVFDLIESKITAVKNSDDLVAALITREYNGSEYENTYKQNYTYTASGLISGNTSQDWDGAVWENDYKSEYTYDGAGNLTTESDASWNSGANDWDNTYKQTYTYNTENQMTSHTEQIWSGDWSNSFKYLYSYTDGKLTEIIYQNGSGTNWNNSEKTTYTYDEDGNRTVDLTQNWNGGSWENYSRYTYTFDPSGLCTSYVSQSWDGSTWQNDYNILLDYEGNNVSEIAMDIWNAGDWEHSQRLILSHNDFDQLTSFHSESWNAGGFWELTANSSGANLFYETYDDGTGIQAVDNNLAFTIYPNPAGKTLNINCASDNTGLIEIYDNTGRCVLSQEIQAAGRMITIDITSLSRGIYTLKLSDRNISGSKLFVVE